MATAREENNPYNGLGAGGKFRKKPYRRVQATPYDRPPSSIRNPSIVGGGGADGAGNGWLRKIVDPAQRLVISTAHRLFSSVFTKRLTYTSPPPPSPPQPPVSSENQEAREKQKEAICMDILEEQETTTTRGQNSNSNSEEGCIGDLEKILKHRTFTTSEVDHLMALLRERAIDKSFEKEQKASKSVRFHERKEELANTNVPDHDSESFRISSKPGNSTVLNEDAGSPADLAKAYMGSRPSKVSPSVLGLRNQTIAEDCTVLTSLPHPSKSPILSIVPRSSSHVWSRENGYATPRPRGRSAIYSMARTPYSRGHLTLTPKSSGPLADGLRGSSPATQTWDGSRSSESKALKRNSSIFENDIGSAASTRRIRQKPSLSYQKNWLVPVSGSGVTLYNDSHASTSAHKMLRVSEEDTFIEQSARTESNSIPGKIPPVSSKSSEVASRILQQLDTIVSPPKERPSVLKLATVREKVPAKMASSKLQGQALKSLEHIDSSNFLEFVHDSNKQDGSIGTSQQNSRDATSEKKESDRNGLSNTLARSDKLSPPVNSLDRTVSQKESLPSVRSGAYNLTNSLVNHPMQKKRPFKMSAHEDYIDMEDDSYCNGVAAPKLEGKEKQATSVANRTQRVAQATVVGTPLSILDGRPATSGVNELAGKDVNARQVVADKRVDFSLPSAITSSSIASSAMLATQSTSAVDRSPLSSPIFGFGDKVSSLKDQHAHTLPFGFVANNGSLASNANEAEAKLKLSVSSSPAAAFDSQQQNSISFAPVGGIPIPFTANVQESDKAEDNRASKDEVAKGAPEFASAPALSTSTTSFSFGIGATNSSNGSIVSSPVTLNSTSQKPLSSSPFNFGINTVPSTSTVAAPSPTSDAAPSSPAAPAFKFGLSTTTSVSAAASASSAAPSTDINSKMDGSFGNLTASPFVPGSSISAIPVFGLNAATTTSSMDGQKQESALTGAANGSTQVSESPAKATLTQSVPVQFGSSVAFSSASSMSTTNSLFASSSAGAAAAKLFPSATSFGSSSVFSSEASSASATTSSLAGSATPVFEGSLFKPPSSGGFSFGTSSGSTSTFAPTTLGSTGTAAASTGAFVFGSSSSTGASSFGLTGTSSASSEASPFGTSTVASVFGSSGTSSAASTAPSIFGSNFSFSSTSSPAFPFAAAAPGTSSSTQAFQFGAATPGFGSSTTVFGFNSAAPATNGNNNNNNDQMNMEDTMAEDSVQASSAAAPSPVPVPVFGQQSISPLPLGANPFQFGTGGGGVGGANPFQFGAPLQQQTTPQNLSPFLASGSLDFNAGGSFSLGSGGGDKAGRKIIKVRKQSRKK